MQRLLATLVGGGLALATLVLSADKPWLLFPTHGIVVGVALFLSRTSTAPYAFLLLAVTFVLVLRVYPLRLDASLPRLLAIAARCARTREALRTCALVDEAAAHPSVATLIEQLGQHVTRAGDAGAAVAPPERTLVDPLDAFPELRELAHLYRCLLDAVNVLVDDVHALDEARPHHVAGGIRDSPESPTANASAAAELSSSARLSIIVIRARARSRSAARVSRMSARPEE